MSAGILIQIFIMPRLLLILLLSFLCGLPVFAVDNIELLQKTLAAAADNNERALINKKIGDAYASQDDLPHAAEFYINALSLGKFPVEDRMRLATSISWGGRLPEAAKEFRAIAAQDPANLKAGTALARTLAWMGDNKGALEEIEKVLKRSPGDRDALLVKATVLRRTNEVNEAIGIYNKLLEAGPEFDAQTGLAYALLAKGAREAAAASAASLKPQYPYQKRELKELLAELAAGAKPTPEAAAPAVEDIALLKNKLAAATDKSEQALINKKIGDAYAAKEDFSGASGFYVNALSLGSFSVEDRLKLATSISWGGRLPEAAKEFRAIAAQDPANFKAGTALARVLSWKGDNKGALVEIEKVLKQSPDGHDALLVKAGALRWSNRPKEAAVIYKKLLVGGEDFDARIGLAYALLAKGDRKGARACAASLKPQSPYQEREAASLAAELTAGTKPVFDAGFSYYDDTDFNYVRRYTLAYGKWAGNLKTNLGIAHLDASAPDLGNSADTLSAGAYTKIAGAFGAGGGLSLNQAKSGGTGTFLMWNVRTDKNIADGSIGVNAGTYLMTDTAQLVANRIRAFNLDLSADRNISARVFLNGAYSHKEYSDNNGSNNLQASASYLFVSKKPRMTAGYKFRHLDFRRQSRGAYFDPSRFVSHQVFVSLAFDMGRFYACINPYYGAQSITRYGIKTNDYFSGGSGTLGFKAGKKLSIEASGEGGNYALQSATGFKYYQFGLRAIFTP